MQTIYLDVYVLIDFTVDLLAFFFASKLTHIPPKMYRLVLASIFGCGVSLFLTLSDASPVAVVLISAASFIVALPIAVGKISLFRALRFLCAFLIIEMFLGGAVTLLFRTLDAFIAEREAADLSNRNLLIIAAAVLLLYGSVKTLLAVFRDGKCEKSVSLEITIAGKKCKMDALVDSGNLAVDPMSLLPVMFICESAWRKYFKNANIEEEIEGNISLKKAFRLIPIEKDGKTEAIYAFRPEETKALVDRRAEPIAVVVALEKNRKDFGGYEALVPLSAISDILGR